MSQERAQERYKRLTTPRAAAIAGILFAVLFSVSVVLLRLAVPAELEGGLDWVVQGRQRISIALALVPFAGIAFLWFVGVVRDRLGDLEDQFFSTLLFGSGLLFIAMIFTSMAIAGGILASAAAADQPVNADIVRFGRAIMVQISNIYALRMAGIFMTSLGTIWLRTGSMPRWLAVLTFLLAIALLLIYNLNLWVALIFPSWVFLVSVYILIAAQRRQPEN